MRDEFCDEIAWGVSERKSESRPTTEKNNSLTCLRSQVLSPGLYGVNPQESDRDKEFNCGITALEIEFRRTEAVPRIPPSFRSDCSAASPASACGFLIDRMKRNISVFDGRTKPHVAFDQT
jgi:hypothetical protein